MMRRATIAIQIARAVLALVALVAIAAPAIAPYSSTARFPSLLNAPPTRLHIVDADGHWRAPFVYPWRLESRLEQRYSLDRSQVVPLHWFRGGHIVESSDETRSPLLLLGADSFGRDLFSRLVLGSRLSLGLAVVAALGAMVLGAAAGGFAGYIGGRFDGSMMGASEFVMVLPAMYVALALRAVLPLVLTPLQIFLILAAIFAIIGAPFVARAVRGVLLSERRRDYVIAAESLGASRSRVLLRHLLPAARGVLAVQTTLLVPGFIVSEATLSYVGLGFPDRSASWGTLLSDASTVSALADFPWLLSPAIAIFAVVLALNVMLDTGRANTIVSEVARIPPTRS